MINYLKNLFKKPETTPVEQPKNKYSPKYNRGISLVVTYNQPEKQLDVIDLTKLIRDVHYKLQLDYQALMGKTAALEAENVELKAKLDDLHKWINQGGGKKTNT